MLKVDWLCLYISIKKTLRWAKTPQESYLAVIVLDEAILLAYRSVGSPNWNMIAIYCVMQFEYKFNESFVDLTLHTGSSSNPFLANG